MLSKTKKWLGGSVAYNTDYYISSSWLKGLLTDKF